MAKRPSTRSRAQRPGGAAAPKPKRAARRRLRIAADPASGPSGPSDDDIRRRAYERYLERGGNHGQHFDDWLEAEKEFEVRSKK